MTVSEELLDRSSIGVEDDDTFSLEDDEATSLEDESATLDEDCFALDELFTSLRELDEDSGLGPE